MTIIDNFTLENLPGKVHKPDIIDRFFNLTKIAQKSEWQEDSARSKVLFDGEITGATLDGVELRAQFRHRDGCVLFTDYDYYEGAETYISFLNFDFEVLDTLTLDGMFSRIGFAFGFEVLSADGIEFSIYEEKRKRRLKIISPPAAASPANCSELTARSFHGHFTKHYLKLETETI